MILAFDTYYFDKKAKTVCVLFDDWSEENYKFETEIIEHNEEYKPGEFYKRELPCILSLLKKIKIDHIETIIVDGYVYLDDNLKLGLGGHLYKNLECNIPIIGVAKTNFKSLKEAKKEVLRGNSEKPLYITSIGIELDQATKFIKNMSGQHRIPTLLKKLDSLTKEKNCG